MHTNFGAGTLNYALQSTDKNQIGLANYLGEANNRSDVRIFLQNFRPEAAGAAYNFTVQIIANGNDQQTPNNSTQLTAGKDLEGNLDAETILSATYPTPLTAYNTGGSPPFTPDDLTPTNTNEPYLTWLQYILNQTDIPQVISTSYGDDEQTVPFSFATSVCKGFAQLGARGISLLFASGDNGVGQGNTCFTNDGRNATTFLAQFPAGCVSSFIIFHNSTCIPSCIKFGLEHSLVLEYWN
jgi:tripeptidyl-peptidase-1